MWSHALQREIDDTVWTEWQSSLLLNKKTDKLDVVVDAYNTRYSDARKTTKYPAVISRWGYDFAFEATHAGQVQIWPEKADYWMAHLSATYSDWIQGILLLVSGFDRKTRRFSRHPKSVISLDTISVGFCHYWAGTLPKHLSKLLPMFPEQGKFAFGEQLYEILSNRQSSEKHLGRTRGAMFFSPKTLDVARGWILLMDHDLAVKQHCQLWIDSYVPLARKYVAKYFGSECLDSSVGGKILAAVCRICNSGNVDKYIKTGFKNVDSVERLSFPKLSPLRVLEATYKTPRKLGGYDKGHTFTKILQEPKFQGPATR